MAKAGCLFLVTVFILVPLLVVLVLLPFAALESQEISIPWGAIFGWTAGIAGGGLVLLIVIGLFIKGEDDSDTRNAERVDGLASGETTTTADGNKVVTLEDGTEGEVLMEVSGKGAKTLRPFTTSEEWWVEYKYTGDHGPMAMTIVDEESGKTILNESRTVGHDIAHGGQVGRHQLSVEASGGRWELMVMQQYVEQRAKPAARQRNQTEREQAVIVQNLAEEDFPARIYVHGESHTLAKVAHGKGFYRATPYSIPLILSLSRAMELEQ